jgi:geranylgeranyl reductase family protein
VLLVEEHGQVGSPNHCSGLVTPRTLVEAGIGSWVVQQQVTGAIIYSSEGASIRIGGDRVRALTINRRALDVWLAQEAEAAGCEVAMSCRLDQINREDGRLRLGLMHGGRRVVVSTTLLVGADGASSRVARFLGQHNRTNRIRAIGSVIELPSQTHESMVRVFAGESVAPGWFGWLIPEGGGVARLGVGATVESGAVPSAMLERLIQRFPHEFCDARVRSRSGGVIPLYQPIRTYGENVLLVGDAARQVKPFSGGGIRAALVGARLCAAVSIEALEQGDVSARFLSRYEQRWRAAVGREFEVELCLRTVASRLSDAQLHQLVLLLDHPLIRRFTQRYGDIDFPGRLFARMTRQPSLREILLSLSFLRHGLLGFPERVRVPEDSTPNPATTPRLKARTGVLQA